MTLDDGRIHDLGHDHEITFRTGGAVEHGELEVAVAAANQPARQTVGESAGIARREALEMPMGDGEIGGRVPAGGVGSGLDDRPEARDPPLVHRRPERVVELGEEHRADRIGHVDREPLLGQLLGESPQAPGDRAFDGHARTLPSRPDT